MSVLVPLRRASAEGRSTSRPSAEPTGKAGPIGPGAGPLLTEYALASVMKRTPQETMKQAANLWREVSWIRVAERVISGTVAGSPIPGMAGKVGWHLEDPEGDTIGEDYKDKRAVEAYNLFSHPQAAVEGQRLTRREMWQLTSRHMGICGPSFWYKDQQDLYGIPKAYMYVRPDRLFPVADDDGNLQFWLLDADKKGRKPQRIEITDLLQFNLELPDEGFFGVGLVVSAINKIQFGTALDRHATAVVASGGRLSGIISPKQGVIDNDNIYQQLVRDWRNIAEQPEAAKRAQVVRYPIEFTKTVADMQQLEVIKLLQNNRDELLELWGVPLSQIGGNSPAGLNSGDIRKYDRAALLQNAVEPRCDVISEVIQSDLDCWKPYLGWAPKFRFDVPQYEDDSPRYDKVTKSLGIPMKGWERRELIGLDPLGPEIKDDQGRIVDDLILINNTLVDITQMGQTPQAPVAALPPASPGQSMTMPTPPVPPKAPEPPKEKKPSNQPPEGKAKVDQASLVKLVMADLSRQYPPEALEWVPELTWEYDEGVKTKKMDGKPGLNKKIIGTIAMSLKVGAPMDPFVLVRLPSQDQLVIANGNKRYAAAEKEGMKRVPAYIGTASLEDETEVASAVAAMQDPKYQEKAPPAKANLRSAMRDFRAGVETEMMPRLRASAAMVLAEQKRSVLGEVRLHHQHVVGHPADSSVWWKPERWNAALLAALSGSYKDIGEQVATQINAHKADLGVSFGPAIPAPVRLIATILEKAAQRVTQINETTRSELVDLIEQGAKDGLSPAELGDSIEGWTGWDEYRAERIATTELGRAYNDAAIGGYRDAGVEYVTAMDGDADEQCAARNGNDFTITEAASIEDHPNGTLDWLPVVGEGVGE